MSKVYENIVQTINGAIYDFTKQIGVRPNRLIMSKDVIDYLVDYTDKCITICKKTDAPSTMFGLEIEVVYDKPGFIEVGYVTHTPYRVNVNYEEGKEAET